MTENAWHARRRSVTHLIADVLCFGSLESGKFPIVLAPANVLQDLVNPAWRMVRQQQPLDMLSIDSR